MTRSSIASMMRSISSLSAGLFEFDSLSALWPGDPDALVSPTSDEPPPVLLLSSGFARPKTELSPPPVDSRRTTLDPTAERKIVVLGDDAKPLDDDPPEDDERRTTADDGFDLDVDEDDRVLRSAAGREAGLRRMVPAVGAADGDGDGGGGAPAPGDEAASAPIKPPLAPTTIPAVPNVGVRPSFDCIRRIVSAAGPAIDAGCTARMRCPVARARSSSGE